jgi:hypothetical protein
MYLDDTRSDAERSRHSVPLSTWLTIALAGMLILGGILWALLEQFMTLTDGSSGTGVDGGFGSLSDFVAAVPAAAGAILLVAGIGAAILIRGVIRRGR